MKLWKKWYGTTEAAEKLGISTTTVWSWCRKGLIKAWRTPGGHYRIPREELERLLKEQGRM